MQETDHPFEIPGDWAWAQLAQIGFINPRNEAEDSIEASFVPMPMIFSAYGRANQHQVRLWGEIKKGFTHFAEGDVGLAKITPCFENGKSTVFRNLTGGLGAGTTELHIVRPIHVDADYILVFLKSSHFIGTGIPKMTGTAGQKRVSKDYFAFAPFSLPPLAEQQRIVAKVDELMALCDELEAVRSRREARRDRLVGATLHRLNNGDGERDAGMTFKESARFYFNHLPRLTARPEHIKALRQTILDLAVRGKLVEQDPGDAPAGELLERIEGERARLVRRGMIKRAPNVLPIMSADMPFQLPRSWLWLRLGHIGDWGSGSTPPRGNPEYYGGDVIWLKSGELEDMLDLRRSGEKVTTLALEKCSFRLNKVGDVLIAMYGATIGKLAILGEPAVTNQAVCGCTPYEGVLNRYLFLFLLSRRADFHAASEGGAQPNISKVKIVNSPFPLPPIAEQHRIVAKVDELMARCDELESRLSTSNTIGQSLITAVLDATLYPNQAEVRA